ncbi:hypothetical protein FDUTEX481_05100 [Tolypothrix sp. PCC 7601]|nr:hypothetical protein FDUTEX481_05100 [Tolypothrix sp. PCC 7601]
MSNAKPLRKIYLCQDLCELVLHSNTRFFSRKLLINHHLFLV